MPKLISTQVFNYAETDALIEKWKGLADKSKFIREEIIEPYIKRRLIREKLKESK